MTSSDTQARLSIITAERPKRISKAFTLGFDGTLRKHPGGALTRGRAEVRKVETMADLSMILSTMTPAQALVYGIPPAGASLVVSRTTFEQLGCPPGMTPRTNEAFRWPNGPGFLMIDHDPGTGRDALDPKALVAAIRGAAPGVANAVMLWFPSASSSIWHGDRELRGIAGQRLWMMVADASDIPRAGKVLVDRLWLARQGYIEVSKAGALLERTLIDRSVWQPSRLDFAGGAECADGLEQRRGAPVRIAGTIETIDTRAALPDLTPAEHATLAEIKAAERAKVTAEANATRDRWILDRVVEMMGNGGDDPDRRERSKTAAGRALNHGVLSRDFVLHVEVAGRVEPVTVGEALDDPQRWHGLLCRDPVEPMYDGGRPVGRLYLMQARPTLHSFAHGGATYRLQRVPAAIQIDAGGTNRAVDATVDLLRADPLTFDFGGQIATIEGGKVHVLEADGLAYHLGGIVQFEKRDVRANAFRPSDPSEPLLRQIIALGERRRLKNLEAVITAPVIRLDGSVLDLPGYDERTRLFLDSASADLPRVIERPTMGDAHAALAILMAPFERFPFVDEAARGALLAALLTAAVRAVLPTSPAFAFDAPVQGSGKTLLASCVGALVEGTPADVWPHTRGRDDEETRKRLFTALRTGRRALIWDNITGTIDSPSMAAFITAPAMVDRVLGKSEAIRVPNRALLILTGNNLSLAGDMPRRVIVCRIDPETLEPFAREFDLDPLAYCLEHREDMVAAACTLIRARLTHMDTPAPGRLASFEDWDNLVRQTVVWANQALDPRALGDPMDLIREAQVADPEMESLHALLQALRSKFGANEFSANDVLEASQKNPNEIEAALIGLVGQAAGTNSRGLGRVLKNREGRICGGLRLLGRVDKHRGSRMFRVEPV